MQKVLNPSPLFAESARRRSYGFSAAASLSVLLLCYALGATAPESKLKESAIIGETLFFQTSAVVSTGRQGSIVSPRVPHEHAVAERPTRRGQEYEGGAIPDMTTQPTPSLVTRALAVVAIAVICIGLVVFFVSRLMPEKQDDPALLGICHTQVFSIGVVALAMWGHLTPLTTCYDMVVSLRYGASMSGLIIGAYFALAVPALLLTSQLVKPWNHSLSWTNSMRCMVVTGLSQLGFMAVALTAAGMPGIWGISLLILTRVVMGFGSTIVESLAKLMAQKVTSKENMAYFQIQYSSATAIGMAMGPLLSSAIGIATAAQDPGSRLGFPSGYVGLLWLVTVPLVWFLVPKEPEAMLRQATSSNASGPGASVNDQQQIHTRGDAVSNCEAMLRQATSSDASGPGVSVNDQQQVHTQGDAVTNCDKVAHERKVVWWSAVSYELERMVSQVAIEVATSLILEVEFNWHPTHIGVVVACGFLIGVPVNEVFLNVRRRVQMSDTLAARVSSVLSTVSILLLWPGVGARLFGSDVVTMMLAEILMFPSLRVSKSIIDAASVEFAVPGTFYSQENCLIAARLLSFSFGRFATPPTTRLIITSYGRLCYMFCQLCLNVFGCVTVFKATHAMNTLRGAK